MAQTVKCLSTKWETQVQALGWEDLLQKEMATHSSILASEITWTEKPTVHGVTKSWTQLRDFTFLLSLSLFSKCLLNYSTNVYYQFFEVGLLMSWFTFEILLLWISKQFLERCV